MSGQKSGLDVTRDAVANLMLELSGCAGPESGGMAWAATWVRAHRERLVALLGSPATEGGDFQEGTAFAQARATRFEAAFREMFAVGPGASKKEALLAALWLLRMWANLKD